ncbi:MAG TPA: ATP-binding SpoIIE family protein phosphatase [Oligoflexus sp.]|uniref:ATP-binding SpoIIE family protein phosphatase n=1 Tax=Oligoflexus sp. TaxID=1971216 RepID=UPI002D5C8E8D|nr:ATP-binding SpoIIE family protein phosphatase [Oligoflexus sp.]HYX37744.1 ATP-binding SpoIIE family protein phosphatase [Oligoflexus sp.]
MITPIMVEIAEASQVGEARRIGQRMAASCGFDEIDDGRVSLIITEAATNILRYGNGGSIILQACYRQDETLGMEILALDRGPGMSDPGACLRDGYSTGGTQGSGLGAMQRLSDCFDIYSALNKGTAILCRVFPRKSSPEGLGSPKLPFSWGSIAMPYPGEDVCGDSWAACVNNERGIFLVVDGLGHGLGAADASREAVSTFKQMSHLEPLTVMQHCNDSLRKTRGAAAAITEIDLSKNMARYTGIGNIAGSITSVDKSQHMVSQPGILGHSTRKFQEFTYSRDKETILIMHSDGLSTRCDLRGYPGLIARDPTLIAGVLFRDFQRDKDDATIIVVRTTAPYTGLKEWKESSSL